MAEKVIGAGLKGYGSVRLTKLDREDLEIVARAFEVEPDGSTEDLVKKILAKKKKLPTVIKDDSDRIVEISNHDDALRAPVEREDNVRAGDGERKEPNGAKPEEEHDERDGEDGEDGVVIVPPRPAVRVIAFNSLKLRVGDARLTHQWLKLVEEMAQSDVVLASEVPAAQADDRVAVMRKMLCAVAKCNWSTAVSEASDGEVHVAFLKDGMTLKRSRTLTEAGGAKLAYAPLQVLAHDATGQHYLFTSVHFPPEKRKDERNAQMRAFLSAYANEASTRMNCPFSAKAAREARKDEVVHVIGGDWNCFPPMEARTECRPFSTFIGSRVATTSGGRSFDHFLVNGDAAAGFAMSGDLIELAAPQNSSKGEIGLSDHSPISLLMRQAPRAR